MPPQVLAYGLICSASLFVGALVSSRWWAPSDIVKSYIQHVAGGLVVAAVSVEVLPDLLHRALPVAAAIGFALGVAVVMGIELLSEKLNEKRAEGGAESPWPLVGVVTTDITIDGLLIGVASVAAGEGSQALLVTIALAAEMASLGLSIGCTLNGSFHKDRTALVSGIMAIAPTIGAVAGFLMGRYVNGYWTEGILAFAAAALLYLAIEELFKEAHEVEVQKPLANVLFFGSFFAIMIIDMIS